jgi:protein O-GlcNAc transferase
MNRWVKTSLESAMAKQTSGDLAGAREAYLKILAQEPNQIDAWHLLGLVAYQAGDASTGVECMQHAIKQDPNVGVIHANLGIVLESLGRNTEAEEHFLRGTQLDQTHVPSWNGLGNLLRIRGDKEGAQKALDWAIKLDPQSTDVLNNLGLLAADHENHELAIGYFDKTLRIDPNHLSAWLNRGLSLRHLDRFEESLDCYRKAIQLAPSFPTTYVNLSALLQRMNRYEESIACLREAMRHKSHHEARSHSDILYLMHFLTDADEQQHFEEHRSWGEKYATFEHLPLHERSLNPDRPLRIGYISPDFRIHAMQRFIEPVLQNHDRSKYELYAYAEVAHPDEVTTRFQRYFQHWQFTCGKTDLEVAKLIQQDKIDILIDLAGHTAKHRLIAMGYKPAPIQATWLGSNNTSGVSAIDYLITDAETDPVGVDRYYTEELVRLPYGLSCFAPPLNSPVIQPPPFLKNGYFTFGALHRPEKLSPQVFALWARVLHAIPDSRLLIFWGKMNTVMQKKFKDDLETLGIPADRMMIESVMPEDGYLSVYHRIDIGLDVFPWTGGTTTHEALWMGVPVLGLRGKRAVSRGTSRILAGGDLLDWVSDTHDEYVAKAIEKTSQPEMLHSLRMTMRDRMNRTLCDGVRFTRTLESAYCDMWHRYCREHTGS